MKMVCCSTEAVPRSGFELRAFMCGIGADSPKVCHHFVKIKKESSKDEKWRWNPVTGVGHMVRPTATLLLAIAPLVQGLQTLSATPPRTNTPAATRAVPEVLELRDWSRLAAATTLEDKLVGQVQAALGPPRHAKVRKHASGASTLGFLHEHALQRRSVIHGHHFAFYRGVSSYPGAAF